MAAAAADTADAVAGAANAATSAAIVIATTAAAAAADVEGMPPGPVDLSTYVPGPVEVGWQIWFGAIIATIPFVIGAYEFGKRIVSAGTRCSK